jgi:hypothetical protein
LISLLNQGISGWKGKDWTHLLLRDVVGLIAPLGLLDLEDLDLKREFEYPMESALLKQDIHIH